MIKNKDLRLFSLIMLASLGGGYFIVGKHFNYSALITFLSVMVGFKVTSLAILFNSPLKKELWDIKNNVYITALHRLKSFYKFSMLFHIVAIIAILLTPKTLCFEVFNYSFHVKQLLVLPILSGVFFLFYTIFDDLLDIFTHPTNH